jgi:hypothetical protein
MPHARTSLVLAAASVVGCSVLFASLAHAAGEPHMPRQVAFANGAGRLLHAPVIPQLIGGLRVNHGLSSVRMNPNARSLSAFPLITPVVGFRPLVGMTLTDFQGPNDFTFTSIQSFTRLGNTLPRNGTEHTILATLDSGGQSHIVSAANAEIIDLVGANRNGAYTVVVQGASGQEELDISDALGVWVTGVANLNAGPTLSANPLSYVGQYRTAILTAQPGSVLPSIVGVPMFAQYRVNISNTQTRRFETPEGTLRSPNITFNQINSSVSTTTYPQNLSISLLDVNNSATSQPAFFPDLGGSIQNLNNNPQLPTFWSFPFANATVAHTSGTQTDQFLFDTGAQVTVLSEEMADQVGFDVGVDQPDFFVDVLGVGGITQVPGFFLQRLELSVTGGSFVAHDVPVLVLNITDPRDAVGFVPGILGMNLFSDRDLSINLSPSNPSVRMSLPITPQWTRTTSGAWSTDSHWSLGSPDGIDGKANFLGAISAPITVNVDNNVTVGRMIFDNTNAYTLNGPGEITFTSLGRPSLIRSVTGNHVIQAKLNFDARQQIEVSAGASLSLTGDTTSPLTALTKLGPGLLNIKAVRVESLTVNSGTVRVLAGAGNASTSRVESLTIQTGSSFDLTDARLIIDYEASSPLNDVRTLIASARLTSSHLNSDRGIGYAEASALELTSFGGITVDTSSVLVRMTLLGDTNLDGAVNFTDLIALARAYNASGSWINGDSNADGTVGFADLLALSRNYNLSLAQDGSTLPIGTSSFAADWALAVSMVPEPASLALLACTGLLVSRRRR